MKCDICVCTYDNPRCKQCPELKSGLEALAIKVEDSAGQESWRYGEMYIAKKYEGSV